MNNIKSRDINRKRCNVSCSVDILMLVDIGITKRTNLSNYGRMNWVYFNGLLKSLSDNGYLNVNDNGVVLTSRGKELVGIFRKYSDFFSIELNKFINYRL